MFSSLVPTARHNAKEWYGSLFWGYGTMSPLFVTWLIACMSAFISSVGDLTADGAWRKVLIYNIAMKSEVYHYIHARCFGSSMAALRAKYLSFAAWGLVSKQKPSMMLGWLTSMLTSKFLAYLSRDSPALRDKYIGWMPNWKSAHQKTKR